MTDSTLRLLSGVFALLVGVAGWYYLFFSTAAQKLAGFEPDARNRLRVRLRKLGGVCMSLLAVAFYVTITLGTREGPSSPARATGVAIAGTAVLVLLIAILMLAWADVRLTRKLRQETRREQDRLLRP